MKLEIGKRYVRRDGLITAPLRASRRAAAYPLWDDDHALSYTPNGVCLLGAESNPDIVAEYEDPAPEPPSGHPSEQRMVRIENGASVIVHRDHFVMPLPVLTRTDLQNLLAEQDSLNDLNTTTPHD